MDTNTVVTAFTTALVLYEYCITLSMEVSCFWKRKHSVVTVLFFLNRYICLINRVIIMTPVFWQDVPSCSAIFFWFEGAFSSLGLIIAAAISTIRTFALWNRSVTLATLVLLFGLVPPIMSLYFLSRARTQAYVNVDGSFCGLSSPASTTDWIFYASRSSAIVADILVMVLTWMKTYGVHCNSVRLRSETSLTGVILRDGLLYFFNILIFNIFTIFIVPLSGIAFGLIANFADLAALEATFMSRFMLDLRSAAYKSTTEFSTEASITWNVVDEMGVRFRDVDLGSMEDD